MTTMIDITADDFIDGIIERYPRQAFTKEIILDYVCERFADTYPDYIELTEKDFYSHLEAYGYKESKYNHINGLFLFHRKTHKLFYDRVYLGTYGIDRNTLSLLALLPNIPDTDFIRCLKLIELKLATMYGLEPRETIIPAFNPGNEAFDSPDGFKGTYTDDLVSEVNNRSFNFKLIFTNVEEQYEYITEEDFRDSGLIPGPQLLGIDCDHELIITDNATNKKISILDMAVLSGTTRNLSYRTVEGFYRDFWDCLEQRR